MTTPLPLHTRQFPNDPAKPTSRHDRAALRVSHQPSGSRIRSRSAGWVWATALAALAVTAGPSVCSASTLSADASEAAVAIGNGCSVTNGIRDCDEMHLISTRGIGGCCDPAMLMSGLQCETYTRSDGGSCRQWQQNDLATLLAANDPTKITVIYVHGNQVSAGLARQRGLATYRRMIECASSDKQVRFIIFSWPSTQIKGPLKDVRVKAARTRPAGFQLAWVIDQMPGDLPMGLIGFSYGPRVITGALHILGGGTVNGLGLVERAHPDRAPMRVVLVAAALHSNWLGAGQYHGQAMTQVDKMLLINNHTDRALKLYHLSTPSGSPKALGSCGPTCIGDERHKIRSIDVSRAEGPKHEEMGYLCVPGTACRLWNYAAWE